MVPFFLFLGASAILALLHILLPSLLSDWRTVLAVALTTTFLFTGVTHFTPMKRDYIAMVPSWLPSAAFLVSLTGIVQLLGAAPKTTVYTEEAIAFVSGDAISPGHSCCRIHRDHTRL